MKNKTALALVAAFAIGCDSAKIFIVPPAHASGSQKWEYFCFEESEDAKVTEKANKAGAQGWEMSGSGAGYNWCFKRGL